MDKDKAIQRYIKSQESLNAALASIPNDQKSSLTVEGTWTIKEVLCHFIGWDKTLLEPLSMFLATGNFPVIVIKDHDLHNAQQISNRQGLSLEKIITEATETSQQLIDLVSRLDFAQSQIIFPAPWGGESTIPDMLAGLAWHANEHIEHINRAVIKSKQ